MALTAPVPEYECHEYANLLPMMSAREFADLKKSVESTGLQEPIVLYKGKILDGRNRYKACLSLGTEPRFSEVEIRDDQEAIDYVVTHNLQRRNLTAGQKAVVALKAYPLIKGAVREERIQRIRDAIAAKRIDEKTANLPSSDDAGSKRGRKKERTTVSVVGDLFSVSATYVRYAEALQTKDSSLLDEVITGKAQLYDLYRQHCPSDAERAKRGPKPNPVRTKLNALIRLVGKKDMATVLAKLEEAKALLADIQCEDKPGAGAETK